MKAAGKPVSCPPHALPTSPTDTPNRQHFQGLRRAQQKAEANGALADSPRKLDPTLNPITRRPGPGRGRPRKSTSGIPSMPGASPLEAPLLDPNHQPLAHHPHDPHQMPQPMPPQPSMDPNVGPAPTPMMDAASQEMQDMHVPPPPENAGMQTDDVEDVKAVIQDVDGVGGLEVDGAPFGEVSEEPEEHVAKRAKIEEDQDSTLNDEARAILSALAAHNNPAEDYNTE